MVEVWKAVAGYEGLYEASTFGNIRRVETGLILKPRKSDKYGHLRVNISVYGIKKTVYVHQMVALAFIGLPQEGQEVRHLNGNPADNNVSNLAYGTKHENHVDMLKMGRGCKFTPHDVKVIRRRISNGESQSSIAREYGVSRQTINKIYNEKSYVFLKVPV